MSDKDGLCEVGDYGPCGDCERTVGLVLDADGNRWDGDAVASVRREKNQGFVCEFCMRKTYGKYWEIDDYTEKYFDSLVIANKEENPTHKKITTGFVVQTYDGNKCIAQEFIAGDDVSYETVDGEPLPDDDRQEVIDNEVYQPFNMVQPSEKKEQD